MTFVETICGARVRVHDVREVRASVDNEYVAILRFADGREREVTWDAWSDAEWHANLTIIPAQLGTFILHTDHDGNRFGREPVVGWAVGKCGFTRPVTAKGFSLDVENDPVIQHPDGTVGDLSGVFGSYDQWLEQLKLKSSEADEVVEETLESV